MLQCQNILILGIIVEDGGITYQLVISTPKTDTWPQVSTDKARTYLLTLFGTLPGINLGKGEFAVRCLVQVSMYYAVQKETVSGVSQGQL